MQLIDKNGSPGIAKVLVANKNDLPKDQHKISVEQGEALARTFGIKFF